MALFGVDFYGASKYGPRVFLNYDASPLTAEPLGAYGRLNLTWSTPVGDWSVLRLVRNSFGVPVNQDDGVVLVDSASGSATPAGSRTAPVRSYIDTGLTPGSFQYYAIYVYVPGSSEWTRAALTTGLVLKDYGYSDRLWELTPAIFRGRSANPLDPGDNEELRSFEQVFGAALDGVRGEYETLLNVNDPDKVSGNLLPLMAQQYGQFFEPELGMKQMRRLLRETVSLYRMKGTIPGITGFVGAVTNFGAYVKPKKNLLLDYNDSSAEESIGSWDIQNGVLSRYISDGTIATPSPLNSMRRVGMFKIVATGGDVTMRLVTTTGILPQAAIQYGIPVVANQAYTVSSHFRAGSTGRVTQLSVTWYTAAGVVVSSSAFTNQASDAVGSWVRTSSTATAPATAAYAGISLRLVGAVANEVHYVDAVQLESGSSMTDFEDARLIDIVAVAPRINLFTNPAVSVDTTGWAVTNGTMARTTVPAPLAGATHAVQVTSTAGQTGTLQIGFTGQQNTSYMVSTYVYGPAGTYGLNPANNGSPTTLTTVAANTWTRLSAPAVITTVLPQPVMVAIQGPVGSVFYVTQVLSEVGVNLAPYFDGSTFQSVGDTLWEGTAHASRSHFYPQRRAKNFRVTSLLPEYTPMGSSFRVSYAVATTAPAGEAAVFYVPPGNFITG